MLNRAGKRTGKGNGWTQAWVRSLRNHRHVPLYRDGERTDQGEVTLDEAAAVLNVSKATVRALRRDMRFGSTACQLGVPAAALRGLAYPPSYLNTLKDLVGPSVAKDILFSGRRLKAEEAYRVGLLNRSASCPLISALSASQRQAKARKAVSPRPSVRSSRPAAGQPDAGSAPFCR